MMLRRLGTAPPAPVVEEPHEPRLGLSVRLDQPFHELKEYLVSEFERAYLVRVLEASAMNLSEASRNSGLSRKHIRTLMAKYGMVAHRALTIEGEESSGYEAGTCDMPAENTERI
jgi:DNA-binding NtrC family response regulator